PHRTSPSFPTRRSSDLEALAQYRASLGRDRALIRDELRIRVPAQNRGANGGRDTGRATDAVSVDEVEPIERIVRRFVTSAMSVGDRKSTRLNSSHVSIS